MEKPENYAPRRGVDLSTARVISETFFVSASRIMILILKPVRAFVLGRVLGPFLYGVMNIATPYIQILTLSSNIGFNDVLLRMIPKKVHEGKAPEARSLFHSAEILVVILSAIWYILLLIFSRPILEHWAHQPDALVPFRLYTLITPFLVLNTFYAAVFIAFQRGKLRAKIFLFYGLLSIALPIAAVIWKRNVTAVVAAFVIAEMAGSVAFTVIFRKKVLPAIGRMAGFLSSGVKLLFRQGFLFFFTSLGWNLMNSLDRIMVKFYLPAEQLGFYTMSVLFITVLEAFSSTMGQALVPSLAAARSAGDGRTFAKQITNSARLGFMAMCPVVIAAFFLAENIFMIILPSFEPAIDLVRILIFIGIFDLISRISRAALVADGRSGLLAGSYIFAAVWNVAWNLALIPRMGLAGAAIASLSSFIILAAALYVMMWRISGVSIKPTHVVTPIILSLSYPLARFALPDTGYLVELIVVLVAGTALYLFLLVISGMVRKEDIRGSIAAIEARRETPHVRFAITVLSFFGKVVDRFGR